MQQTRYIPLSHCHGDDAYVSSVAPLVYCFSSALSKDGSSSLIWPPNPDKLGVEWKLLHAEICEVSRGHASSKQRRDSIEEQLVGQSPKAHTALAQPDIPNTLHTCKPEPRWLSSALGSSQPCSACR